MKAEKIREILSLGEGPRVEFKPTARIDIIGREVCAFLNTKGGYVVCGIDEKGTIIGVNEKSAAIKSIPQKLLEGLSPIAFFSTEIVMIEGKSVLVIEAPAERIFPMLLRIVFM